MISSMTAFSRVQDNGDLHPGHVSLAVKENYLSIGTADDMQDVFLTSQHLLAFTGDLIQEIDGFQRVPYAVDLHTLDTEKMISYISDFKKSPDAYTLLGRRFNISEGESCATIVHESLLQGGFSQLMNSIPRQILSENTILTPTSLKDHCEIARSVEHSLYPDAKKLSTLEAHQSI